MNTQSKQTYLTNQHAIIKQYRELDINPESADLWRQFAFFSANCQHFLNVFDHEKQRSLFKDVLRNQHLSVLDDTCFAALAHSDLVNWQAGRAEEWKRRPGIICTYHTGSYRMINHLLVRDKIAFALLVSEKVKQKAGAGFQERHAMLSKENAGELKVLNAEEPNVLFKIKQVLAQGTCLLVYIDGNTGSASGGLDMNFFGRKIKVRKGVAAIAALLKVPIYPIASIRNGSSIQFHHFPSIDCNGLCERNEFVAGTTQLLYNLLEALLHERQAQWEGWLFLHKTVILPVNTANFAFKHEHDLSDLTQWIPFKIDSFMFVLDKISYQSYQITKRIYKLMTGKLP